MKNRILFLAANPAGTAVLKLDEEAHEIQDEIKRANQQEPFEFITRVAVRPMDLLRALRDVKPSIVHFAGHAKTDGIYLVGDDGLPAHVTRGTLLATFGAAGESVRLIVLNGCSTEPLAKALCELVPVCVGTSGWIQDDAARMFSIGFYGALAAGKSVARACLHGSAAMRLAATGDHEKPRLHHRSDVDPDAFVISDEMPVVSSVPAVSGPPAMAVEGAQAVPAAPTIRAAPIEATPQPTTRSPGGTDLIAPLVLLQLSDLHFGPHSRFPESELERVAAQCHQALDEARDELGWRERINLAIVTGDIAEGARPPEYAAAATFFLRLARQLALPPHRFVFVPGNHDVSWTKCREVEGQLEDGAFPQDELRTRLDAVKFAHFEKFIRDVHGGRARQEVDGAAVTLLTHGVFIHDFPDLGVSIAALNSCERESHRKEDHIGMISAAQAQAVLDHWRRTPTELIRLAAVHHNPATMASSAIDQWLGFLRSTNAHLPIDVVERIATNFVGFEGHEYLRNLASDAYTSLILHGHHHASTSHQGWAWRGQDPGGAGDARIVSAGSWGLSPESGKLPKDQPVVMQLIRLDPAAAQLHAVLLTYEPNARLAGEVRPGRFLIDSQTKKERPIGLSLPPTLRAQIQSQVNRDRSPKVTWNSQSSPHTFAVTAAVAIYRARKAGSFERWDLRSAGPTPTVGNRPIELTLDDMYIPLRFDTNLDPTELERGAPITADVLLQLQRPHVVIGSAGTGKTTWMRWTFRRLIRDPRAIPFFLELRVIAAAWKTPQDAARSIDSYLIDEVTTSGVSNADNIVATLLASVSGPQLVVLLDGWDELGAQGERVRERLVEFCRAFPNVAVMVSSRPHGDTRPAGAEAFKTLYIQPLSNDDIHLLATRFHRHTHGLDESAEIHATSDFMTALAVAPDARSLASTALLLTMMLLLSREGPLPDRRHKLYAACLRNMLLHRVDQRERDGVVVDPDQWRPADSEERLRVTAELAYHMQTQGYSQWNRAPIVRTWRDAIDLLRPIWSRDRRERFLRWLVASAGILVDRSDGSVHFAHLSFQEHLAAHYLFSTLEGGERVTMVRSHMRETNWWETLRLWAGLTGDSWPEKLSPVFAMLREDSRGYWLAGMIFADGTGALFDFEDWLKQLAARLSDPLGDRGIAGQCAQSWAECKQIERRTMLTRELESARANLHWLEAKWHVDWNRLANLEVAPAPALVLLTAPTNNARAIARARALFGGAVSWPDSGELAMLRLWPSARSRAAVRLQTAISLGARRSEIIAMFPAILTYDTRPWSTEHSDIADCLFRHLRQGFEIRSRYQNLSPDWPLIKDLARELIRRFENFISISSISEPRSSYTSAFETYFPEQPMSENFIADTFFDMQGGFWQHWELGIFRDIGISLPIEDFWNFTQRLLTILGWGFARDFGQALGLADHILDASWLLPFAVVEVVSMFGRAAPRAMLANGAISDKRPLLSLFRTACGASLTPGDASLRQATVHACDSFRGDSVWPALARHVARISSAEDRTLLEDLARQPEKWQPPLSWGLQFYVRGDVVFDDDSIVTLDELCAQIDVEPLLFLEDMPDELDIPLDVASP